MAESVSLETRGMLKQGISPPPTRIADRCAIFLDFDGTLVNLADRPDEVVVDRGLLDLLDALQGVTAGATALITGRSMESLDGFLTPLRLPVAGIHGAERRRADGSVERFELPAALVSQTRIALQLRVDRYTGLLVEDKGCAFAVHYRGTGPQVAARLRSDIQELAVESQGVFELLEGREVFELRPRVCDKGTALDSFMSEAPFIGRMPIFIGDDQTDRAGFEAVIRVQGMAIAVGPRVTAPWWLPDPSAVRAWLRGCVV